MHNFLLFSYENTDGTFLHWVFAAALTVLILDVIFAASGDNGTGSIMYCVVLEVFSGWGVWRLNLPTQWSILIFLAFSALGLCFYFVLWRKIIVNFLGRHVIKNAPKEHLHQMVGKKVYVYGEGEKACIKWQDEFYPIADADRSIVREGDRVTITEFKDGMASVKKD